MWIRKNTSSINLISCWFWLQYLSYVQVHHETRILRGVLTRSIALNISFSQGYVLKDMPILISQITIPLHFGII
jgi:hypothetical protein